MSENFPRRVLHLVIEGFPAEKLAELAAPSTDANAVAEIFPLTETNAREVLEKIFTYDTVAVWGKVD
jgi:hypothetical protein